jgi:hypothetical protein
MSTATQGPNVGFGIAITFSTGFCAYITGVDYSGMSRSVIDTSNNSLTTPFWRTLIPGKLVGPGAFAVDLLFDPNVTPPITSASETITLTWPKLSVTSAATWAATGFLSEFSASAPMDDKMTAKATLTLSGPITFTQAVV